MQKSNNEQVQLFEKKKMFFKIITTIIMMITVHLQNVMNSDKQVTIVELYYFYK